MLGHGQRGLRFPVELLFSVLFIVLRRRRFFVCCRIDFVLLRKATQVRITFPAECGSHEIRPMQIDSFGLDGLDDGQSRAF